MTAQTAMNQNDDRKNTSQKMDREAREASRAYIDWLIETVDIDGKTLTVWFPQID